MIQSINAGVQTSKPLPADITASIVMSEKHLLEYGFVIPLIIQTPSALHLPPKSKPLKSSTVMALLDTGASRTCISNIIADELDLEPVGASRSFTASGVSVNPDYAVDILFPDAGLKSFENLKVASCQLPYNPALSGSDKISRHNYGILIGRDMMTKWNIVWNGPSSIVFITE